MTAAKKMTAKDLKARLAAKAAEKKVEEKKGKVLDLKSKLKAKHSKKVISIIENEQTKKKLLAYGIEAVLVDDPDFEDGKAAQLRVDTDLVTFTCANRADAIAMAKGLYEHIKVMAKKIADRERED